MGWALTTALASSLFCLEVFISSSFSASSSLPTMSQKAMGSGGWHRDSNAMIYMCVPTAVLLHNTKVHGVTVSGWACDVWRFPCSMFGTCTWWGQPKTVWYHSSILTNSHQFSIVEFLWWEVTNGFNLQKVRQNKRSSESQVSAYPFPPCIHACNVHAHHSILLYKPLKVSASFRKLLL